MNSEELINGEEITPKRKKTGGRVKGSPYKKSEKSEKPAKKEKPALKTEHSFLFFEVDGETYTERVATEEANERAQELFAEPAYAGLQNIYFMKPLRLFTKPVMQITEL